MNQVIISTNERSVFHEQYCPYVNRIRKKYRKQIGEDDAIRKGYCECKFCRSVRGIAYKYRQTSNVDIYYDKVDDAMCVKTDVGFWKIFWRDVSQDWHLFHMNHKGWKHFDKNLPAKILMRGSFHRQEDFKPTSHVNKILSYIKSHDHNYKLAEEDIRKMSKRTAKQRSHYRQQKNRKKRESIRSVYRIFNQLEKENNNDLSNS